MFFCGLVLRNGVQQFGFKYPVQSVVIGITCILDHTSERDLEYWVFSFPNHFNSPAKRPYRRELSAMLRLRTLPFSLAVCNKVLMEHWAY